MRTALAIHLMVGLLITVGCRESPDDTSAAKVHAGSGLRSRLLPLEGQPNFRDLGGYKTADGRTVKWGQVFRSGELSRLSDQDVSRLDELGIRTVANFLTEADMAERGPDRLPEGVKKLPLPMESGSLGELTQVISAARRTGDFSKVPPDLNPEIHRRLMDEGREYYATLLRELVAPGNRPLVFHCSHGVHRAGTAAAILLSALGVPWETIREDYLLSNGARKDEIEQRIGQLKKLDAENRGIPIGEVNTTNLEAFYVLKGFYIDAALDQAVKDYGSMDAYIREGLGLSERDIERLRSELLDD